MKDIFEIASKISTPLALAGLSLVVLFFIFRPIIAKKIFPKLPSEVASRIFLAMIYGVFVLALVAMVLGFAGYVLTIIFPPPNGPVITPPNIEAVSPGMVAGGQQVLLIKYTGDAALPAGVQAEVQVAADQDFHTIWTTQRIPDWQTYQVVVGFPKPHARTGFARIRIVDTGGKLLRVSNAKPFSLDQEVSP